MKAYEIGDYHVAAHNWMQAVGTLAAYIEEEPETIGPATEVNPADVEVRYENQTGGFDKGTLAEIMPPDDGEPIVLLDPDYP